jgi:single-strand DNA-binding protein
VCVSGWKSVGPRGGRASRDAGAVRPDDDPSPNQEVTVNCVTLTGRLTRDPELRELPEDSTLCEMRIAVDGMGRGRDAGFIDVAVFGKPGEAAARVLAKGWLVAVYGRLVYREWSATDGSKRSAHNIVGNVEFLTAPRGNGDTPADNAPAAVAQPDEIPF